ncbi:hypothetical protein ILYODFUR_021801 [Ilyodon furcidens]|uniref:Uncharacterized protein n=1 Tax=Ilyodon furcidens TaxID=33524 RepID=A0ABV0UU75_9TELE
MSSQGTLQNQFSQIIQIPSQVQTFNPTYQTMQSKWAVVDFPAIPHTEPAFSDNGKENSFLRGRHFQQNQTQCEWPGVPIKMLKTMYHFSFHFKIMYYMLAQ